MLDYKKLALYAALFVVSMMLWQAWQQEQIARIAAQPQSAAQQADGQFIPSSQGNENGESSVQAPAVPHPSSKAAVMQNAQDGFQAPPADRLINVKTDVLNLTIDTQGGNIVETTLPKFPKTLNAKDDPYTMFNTAPETWYQSQSGFTDITGRANHRAPIINYKSTQKIYTLGDKNAMDVVLTGRLRSGIEVQKVFHFTKNNYLVNVEYQLKNQSGKTWSGHLYTQLVRKEPASAKKSMFHVSSYTGASISNPADKKYEKISFKSMKKTPVNRVNDGGWVAMQEHYFLSAWIPAVTQSNHFYSHATNNNVFTIGMISPLVKVAPNSVQKIKANLYVGPENMATLKKIAPGLDLTIDYGWLWFISSALFWLLTHVHSLVGNWGFSIIIVTILIKAMFYKLSATSYKSMARMRDLQPRIEALKERFGDDKQQLGKATMELYQKEKVNPLGGCLPMLVQIPFFIGLYWVLIESVELRQAPFILWINDLAAPDPLYVLPILMGVSMFIQQKLSPPPPDPAQAKMMLALPFVFTFLFATFPSGLVLYWVVNNVLSIAQQWYITQKFSQSKKAITIEHKKTS